MALLTHSLIVKDLFQEGMEGNSISVTECLTLGTNRSFLSPSECNPEQEDFIGSEVYDLKPGFQWGILTYLLIIMEGLIVLKVSSQPCQSLCCHIRHKSQSNQKENKASEWWKEGQKPQIDWTNQSCRETEELAKCSPLLKFWGKKQFDQRKRERRTETWL